MWTKTFSKLYPGISKQAIWQAWSDVNNWPKWDSELEYCLLEKPFAEGNQFILKPKGGPKVKITLLEIIKEKRFIDYCKFIGATMYDDHILEETPDGIRITNIISVKGPLSFIWTKLVAAKVAEGAKRQTDALVAYASDRHG